MPKFLIHRTQPAYVTEIVEIESVNGDAALESVVDGEGQCIGLSVGDSLDAYNETIEIFEAVPHNLPTGFMPINGEAMLDFARRMARFTTPEDEFEALKAKHGVNQDGSVSDGDLGSFADVEELVSELSDERLCSEYATFMEMVREARKLLGEVAQESAA